MYLKNEKTIDKQKEKRVSELSVDQGMDVDGQACHQYTKGKGLVLRCGSAHTVFVAFLIDVPVALDAIVRKFCFTERHNAVTAAGDGSAANFYCSTCRALTARAYTEPSIGVGQ